MQIDPEDFKRHYALLEMDRNEFVEAARPYYDAELAERKLALPESEVDPIQASAETENQAEDGLQLVATFLSLEDANLARGLLQASNIPCSLENEHMAQRSGNAALRLMVPRIGVRSSLRGSGNRDQRRGFDRGGRSGSFQRRRAVVNISPLRRS
jgi:hypothetical protein